ncbi:MAG: polyphosphate kinase 2 family protein [Roseiarcus sp.]
MTASSGAAWGVRNDARLSTGLWSAAKVPPLAVDAVDDRGYGRGRLETLDYQKKFRVKPGEKLRLKKLDPSFTGEHESEAIAKEATEHSRAKLAHEQNLLYAEHKHSVLIVLQAMDAGGKDGTIKHVFSGVNPQGVHVASFKQPTGPELAHDFLWRVHPHTPGRGQISIFNRSHYEDVLVTRVHKLIDKATWTRRYREICDFEALLVQSGTTILKFFLHISKEEQLARFAQRLEDPGRNWKISEADYTERALWDDYIEAFEDAIRATSTHEAPWYVIPSNAKWFRNLAVSKIIADAMADLHLAYPPPSVNLAEIRRKYHVAAHEAVGGGKKA